MKKLIILQGPPASGKSTWTKKFMEENSSTSFVVSRDAIRHSMGDYNHLHEDEVTRIEEAQTKEQMNGKRNGTKIIDGIEKIIQY